ncbi:MAG: hypothetical protein NT158_04255 [Cyanobacteria bacterium]|nr:hypothetical protein [Cyanobacteriota bacterium]
MSSCQPASLAKATFLGLLATGTLGLGAIQPAGAANVTYAAIDATSIASGTPPSSLLSCGAINPGKTLEISYTGPLNITDSYTLEVANINDT